MSENKPATDVVWYIDPLGDSTVNKIIADNSSPEDECCDQRCSDGVKRDLWRCEHDLITRLKRLEATICLHYNVYRKRGQYGQIERWNFERTPRRPIAVINKRATVQVVQ